MDRRTDSAARICGAPGADGELQEVAFASHEKGPHRESPPSRRPGSGYLGQVSGSRSALSPRWLDTVGAMLGQDVSVVAWLASCAQGRAGNVGSPLPRPNVLLSRLGRGMQAIRKTPTARRHSGRRAPTESLRRERQKDASAPESAHRNQAGAVGSPSDRATTGAIRRPRSLPMTPTRAVAEGGRE
jgi:hypothetical protein